MGGKDSNFRVIYRGDRLENFREGEWVFFQRSKSTGGGFWFGRTFEDCFWLEFDAPTSLSIGIQYLMAIDDIAAQAEEFDDDFRLL